jgi:hypothetical protein
VKDARTTTRIRYKPNYQPLFQCPHGNNYEESRARAPFNRTNVQQRILLIKDPSSTVHIRVADFLNHFKLPIHIETLIRDSDLLLQLGDLGRFSLIIFSNYAIYERLSPKTRHQLNDYAQNFHVGIIHFAFSNECQEILCRSKQQAVRLKFKHDSLIPFVARTEKTIEVDNLDLSDWTLLWSNDWTTVLEAEDENGEVGSAVLHKRVPFEQVIIGHDLTTWPINLAFLDVIGYFLGDPLTGGLTRQVNIFCFILHIFRYVQVDIDDVFVAQAGTRLVKDDIGALIRTQKEIRTFVDNFWFTLGFSGYYFKHGDLAESDGDEQLICKDCLCKYLIILLVDASNFLWFPHTWRHNHVHEYSALNLSIIMQLNKEFAKVTFYCNIKIIKYLRKRA